MSWPSRQHFYFVFQRNRAQILAGIFRAFITTSKEMLGYKPELNRGRHISLPYKFIRRCISTGFILCVLRLIRNFMMADLKEQCVSFALNSRKLHQRRMESFKLLSMLMPFEKQILLK
jgi:hypothetical protein